MEASPSPLRRALAKVIEASVESTQPPTPIGTINKVQIELLVSRATLAQLEVLRGPDKAFSLDEAAAAAIASAYANRAA